MNTEARAPVVGTDAWVMFSALTLLMAITRYGHWGTGWSLPDASWAVLFLGGFYLCGQWRLMLPLLLLEASAVDVIAIFKLGVSSYCFTVAYWFTIPAYCLLWLGGSWMRRRYSNRPIALFHLTASLFVSVTLCYLVTNASFYWLSGRVPAATLAGWWLNFRDWYSSFLYGPCLFVGSAALLQSILPDDLLLRGTAKRRLDAS